MQNQLFLSIDAETDGLYGDAFAIGAAVLASDGTVLDTFAGKAEEDSVESAWVRENCLPHLISLPVFDSLLQFREAFWAFYLVWHERCTISLNVSIWAKTSSIETVLNSRGFDILSEVLKRLSRLLPL